MSARKGIREALLKFAEQLDGEMLELPLSMLMQTIFLGGNKGSGKTSAMKRLYEAAHEAGAQCIAIAPLGKWWSLRIAKNGRGRGLRGVIIFGGRFGDVPITPGAGRVIARTIVQKKLHAVLDVEMMRKNERAVFLAEFMDELIMLKKGEDSPSPLVLFVDEAQAIAPQKSTSKEVERLRELMADFARECRNYGAGLVLSAQRSANVDKDLLALVEFLIVMRTVHHLDRKVYQLWVDEKGSGDEDDGAWLRKLRRLTKGEAYAYAPELNVFVRVKILMPKTYDATKTATIGAKVTHVGRLSKLDVKKLSADLTKLVEDASANDPTVLRAEIQKLKVQLAAKQPSVTATKYEQKPLYKKSDARRLEKLAKSIRVDMHKTEHFIRKLHDIMAVAEKSREALKNAAVALDVHQKLPVRHDPINLKVGPPVEILSVPKPSGAPVRGTVRAVGIVTEKPSANGVPINSTMKQMLAALKYLAVDKDGLATLVGKATSGTFDTYVSRLKSGGYIATIDGSGALMLTDKGKSLVGDLTIDLKPSAVVGRHSLINSTMKHMIDVIEASPGISKSEIAKRIQREESGTFDTYISRLKSRGFIVGGKETGNTYSPSPLLKELRR